MTFRKRDILLFVLAFGKELLEETVGAGSRAYHERRLFLLTPPFYPENNFKQALGRLHRQDLVEKVVEKNEVYWRLSQKGTNFTLVKFPLIKHQQQPWDHKWRMVYFDIPEKKAAIRKQFRSHLLHLGFGQAQKSVYLSPYDFIEEMKYFIKANNLTEWVFLYEGEKVWLGENNDKEMVRKIWQLDNIEKLYNNWLKEYQLKVSSLTKENRKKLLSRYLELLHLDPLLPQDLLPHNWIGFRLKPLLKKLL
jgi:phenylacetic acid degradation operon negative regulatory protein